MPSSPRPRSTRMLSARRNRVSPRECGNEFRLPPGAAPRARIVMASACSEGPPRPVYTHQWAQGLGMADLESDIIGRVNRLALRPTEKNALLPLMEAISNSVHSVTDLYGGDAVTKGRIVIRVVREGDDPSARIVGFDVEDNGIGFTEQNFSSFRTPDSRLKETRGGKGVGRLAWLKVFDQIAVDSTYSEDGEWRRRSFVFRLAEK